MKNFDLIFSIFARFHKVLYSVFIKNYVVFPLLNRYITLYRRVGFMIMAKKIMEYWSSNYFFADVHKIHRILSVDSNSISLQFLWCFSQNNSTNTQFVPIGMFLSIFYLKNKLRQLQWPEDIGRIKGKLNKKNEK
jgi:hypothetical protein